MTSDDRLNVLLAEDDDNDLLLLQRVLRRLGTIEQLLRVSDGEQARDYLNQQGLYSGCGGLPFPDLLILDHRMPRLNGLEVLRWLRGQRRFDRLPVVVLGLLSPDEEQLAIRLNASYCLKTANSTEMQHALSEAIVSAMRRASLVPEGAWYRKLEPVPAAREAPIGVV
jgi:CheY-like chemotaxis protein